ncbi:DUF1707 domain-containing protein [Lujinxingia vulgaris]|uniref:DUF1707 domain-containing protein n=1 Tax=Lujinxingia vulgaris TaxID=2600176 RepID=A0A5C6XHQ4_9DELT|nr:DUF1707 domain-containing protein [Lujinxingia vulgaris]TXD38385.1 DUF1707 domain-containing protein [Lujinxingia vulgaris]
MPKNLPPDRVPSARRNHLGPAREETIERLQQAYADDLLTLDELDERLELASRAEKREHLLVLVDDLPDENSGELVPHEAPGELGWAEAPMGVLCIFSNTRRTVDGPAPSRIDAGVFFGDARIDLSEADFSSGVLEVRCTVAFGELDILVPRGVAVEAAGVPILASFSGKDRDVKPGAPVVRLTGFALMGSVKCKASKKKRRKRK